MGQYIDAESGLVYMRARYYDPATGQFLSRDPITATTQQPHSYGTDSPLNNRDPSGLSSCGDISLGGLVDCGAKSAAGVENAIIDFNEAIRGPGCTGAIKTPDPGPMEERKRHETDECKPIGSQMIGGDVIITWQCKDIETGESYRYQTIYTFPGLPPLEGGTVNAQS